MSDAVIGEATAAQVASLAPEAKAAARTLMEPHYSKEEMARVFDAPPAAPKVPAAKAEASPKQSTEQGDSNSTFPIPPSPEGYRLDYSPQRLTMDTASLARFSSELRGALHAAQVPAVFAQSVLDALDASAALYPATMTDVERVAVFQSEGWKLRRSFGDAGAKEIGELASAAYFRLPEAWRAKIDEQHGFSTAQGQAALAAIERAYRQRTGAKS